MALGWFLSYTAFLALNDPEFCKAYVSLFLSECPAGGIVSIQQYMVYAGALLAAATVLVALWPEEPRGAVPVEESSGARDADGKDAPATRGLREAYQELWEVLRLPNVLRLAKLLLFYRLPFLPTELAFSLKLVERGVSRDSIAFLSLSMLPVDLGAAVLAGSLSSHYGPSLPFRLGMWLRFATAAFAVSVVSFAANSVRGTWLLTALITVSMAATTCATTLMFTAQGTLFSKISDPEMGGAYLTLLNTIANLGYSAPKVMIFYLMDVAAVRACDAGSGSGVLGAAMSAVDRVLAALGLQGWMETHRASCREHGLLLDGFYVVSLTSLLVGLVFAGTLSREFNRASQRSMSSWRTVRALRVSAIAQDGATGSLDGAAGGLDGDGVSEGVPKDGEDGAGERAGQGPEASVRGEGAGEVAARANGVTRRGSVEHAEADRVAWPAAASGEVGGRGGGAVVAVRSLNRGTAVPGAAGADAGSDSHSGQGTPKGLTTRKSWGCVDRHLSPFAIARYQTQGR